MIPLNTARNVLTGSGEVYIFRHVNELESKKFGKVGHELIHTIIRSLQDKMPYNEIKEPGKKKRIMYFVEEIFCYSFNAVSKDGTKTLFNNFTPNFILQNFFYIEDLELEDSEDKNLYKEISEKLSELFKVIEGDTIGYLLNRLKKIRKHCSSLEEIKDFLEVELSFGKKYLNARNNQ